MTNDRSYRPAMSVSAARKELKRCAGTQFDPYIVAEFLQLLKEKEDVEKPSAENDIQKEKEEMRNLSAEVEKTENDVHSVFYSSYRLDEDMKILSVDDAFETITGYSKDDIRKKQFFQVDLIPEEERTEYLCKVNAELAKCRWFIWSIRSGGKTERIVLSSAMAGFTMILLPALSVLRSRLRISGKRIP